MEWISVKDKMPFPYSKVIVWIDNKDEFSPNGYYDIGSWDGDSWYTVTNKHAVDYITHWTEIKGPKL